MISFALTAEDYKLIVRLASWIDATGLYPMYDAMMDLTMCHTNGCQLDLWAMLDAREADPANLWGELMGIRANLDRQTGKLTNSFAPRWPKT